MEGRASKAIQTEYDGWTTNQHSANNSAMGYLRWGSETAWNCGDIHNYAAIMLLLCCSGAKVLLMVVWCCQSSSGCGRSRAADDHFNRAEAQNPHFGCTRHVA